jgi:putative DNA methylase
LLSAYLPETATPSEFWRRHESAGAWLADADVYDPFMGGGTSLVEAARMGVSVTGRDVDPLATAVVSAELAPDVVAEAAVIAGELIADLHRRTAAYFMGSLPSEWTPLHWFWLRRVNCPRCQEPGLLYRDLVLARSVGRAGAVVRDHAVHAFCPVCLAIHTLDSNQESFQCCNRKHLLIEGTFVRGRYYCASCSAPSRYEAVRPGLAERVLIAVEDT